MFVNIFFAKITCLTSLDRTSMEWSEPPICASMFHIVPNRPIAEKIWYVGSPNQTKWQRFGVE
jgi:hypothetical protein